MLVYNIGFIWIRTQQNQSVFWTWLSPRPKYRLVLQCTHPTEFSTLPKHVKLLHIINPLSQTNISALFTLKVIGDDKLNDVKMIISICDRSERGENAGYQHVLLFPQCFQKAFFSGASKSVLL